MSTMRTNIWIPAVVKPELMRKARALDTSLSNLLVEGALNLQKLPDADKKGRGPGDKPVTTVTSDTHKDEDVARDKH